MMATEEDKEEIKLELLSLFETPSLRKAEHHHRHESLANRLQAYSDAVFAIVGTILIVYIQNTAIPKFEEHDESLHQHVISGVSLFSVYHFTFLHISVIWLNHTRVFSVIERVDYVLIWLNILVLYSVFFVPLTFGVLGEHSGTYAGIFIPSFKIIVINTVIVIIVWYAFRKKRFLSRTMSAETRRTLYCKLLIAPVFAILATAFEVNLLTAQIIFYCSAIVVLIPKAVIYIINKKHNNLKNSMLAQVLSVTVSKERVEFLTDGVYSLVAATLVILDITESGILSKDVVDRVHNGNLFQALLTEKVKNCTYFTTFLLISLLWIVHHSLFNFIKRLNPLMFLVHQCSLSFIAAIPATIEDFFHSPYSDDEATAIQLAFVAICSVSLLQLVLLALMYFVDKDCVDPDIFHTRSSLYLLFKVIALLVTCLAAYCSSFEPTQSRHYNFVYAVYFSVWLFFIAINVLMFSMKFHFQCWNCCKKLRFVIGKHHNSIRYVF